MAGLYSSYQVIITSYYCTNVISNTNISYLYIYMITAKDIHVTLTGGNLLLIYKSTRKSMISQFLLAIYYP